MGRKIGSPDGKRIVSGRHGVGAPRGHASASTPGIQQRTLFWLEQNSFLLRREAARMGLKCQVTSYSSRHSRRRKKTGRPSQADRDSIVLQLPGELTRCDRTLAVGLEIDLEDIFAFHDLDVL